MLGGIRQIWKEGGIPGFFTGYKCVLSSALFVWWNHYGSLDLGAASAPDPF
jgi:hypothetical protein